MITFLVPFLGRYEHIVSVHDLVLEHSQQRGPIHDSTYLVLSHLSGIVY